MPSSSMIVPPCPTGVVFNREDFLQDNFNIDGFLAKYAGTFGLEMLRDELGMYLQVLRVAMIELINDDYADFVNLSSNLVGIDDRILNVQKPMLEYKSQISTFQSKLDATKSQLETKLAQREALQGQRVALRNLEHIINSLSKVERLLGLNDGAEEVTELTGDLVERVASDVNYLNFCVSKCEAKAFVEEIRPRLVIIGDRLHAAMETQLLEAVQTNNKEVLKRCFRINATVDRIEDAERLVRAKVIAPYLEEIISQQSLHSDPMGLKGVCQRTLKIIPTKLQLLLQLSKRNKKVEKSEMVTDFDFIVRALWPEVVERFEQQLPNMFSAGNPDQFHSNYTTIMDFIKDLGHHVVSSTEALTQCQLYHTFIHKWNLPVYFQIRFQEIASPVEEACQELFTCTVGRNGANTFSLKASEVVFEAVSKCWSNEVFLRPLTQKFWKLSLQVIARYCKAVAICSNEHNLKALLKPVGSKTLKTSETCSTASSSKLSPSPSLSSFSKSHVRSASDTNLGQSLDEDVQVEDFGTYTEEVLNQYLILVYLDVSKMTEQHLESLLSDVVWPALPSDLSDTGNQYFIDSLQDGTLELKKQLPILSGVITDKVATKGMTYLKQVSDIPRLYRRTNRDLPTKSCTYLVAMLDPIIKFEEENKSKCPNKVLHSWLVDMFTKISVKYLTNVSEVLDAVQKMEESLRRLKRVRDKNNASSTGGADKPGDKDKGVSDDDKIRLQLLVDVKHYIKTMEGLGVLQSEIRDENGKEYVTELDKLVVEATKSCYEDYLVKLKT